VVSATVVNDATAQPSTTVTGSAAGTQLTTADNTGWTPTEIIQLPGGTAGALDWYQIRTCGVPIGTDNTTRVDIRPNKALTVAVSAVATQPYYRVKSATMPTKVSLLNTATGTSYEWQRGMNQNSAVVTTSAGARTVPSDTGIVCLPTSINFHPGMLAANQTMLVTITY
jgi:hypothetical protein